MLTISAVVFLIADIVLAFTVIPAYKARQLGTLAVQGSLGQTSGIQGRLQLGKTTYETGGTVNASGGDIAINDANSSINGFSIYIPEGAYLQPLTFDISTTDINGHSYGDDFNPITPLITVNNSEVFANEPIEVTVPISKTDDEFVMGFYYDQETGMLEAIPFVSQTNDEIVLLTKHFSAVVISKTKLHPGRAVDNVYTGFVVGIDDMQIANYGSIIAQGGYCGGQTLAILYYYSRRNRIGYDEALHGRFDNNGLGDTPLLKEDDAYLIRMCSVLQTKINMLGADPYFRELGYNDELIYYAFDYALKVTGHPQIIGVSYFDSHNKEHKHGLIVYGIEGDTMLVADPNFPGQYKTIRLIRYLDGTPAKFEVYISGSNVEEAKGGIAYDTFYFLGDFALVDEKTIGYYWTELMNGEDPGAGVFTKEQAIEVAISQDAEGTFTYTQLRDGLSLSEWDTSTLGFNSEGLLMLRKTDADSMVTVYIGDAEVCEIGTDWTKTTTLRPGNNDIGILYKLKDADGEYEFQNFVRYNVVYGGDAAVTPTLEPTMAFTPKPTFVYTPTPEPTFAYTTSPEPTSQQTQNYNIVSNSRVLGHWKFIGNNIYDEGELYAFYGSVDPGNWPATFDFNDNGTVIAGQSFYNNNEEELQYFVHEENGVTIVNIYEYEGQLVNDGAYVLRIGEDDEMFEGAHAPEGYERVYEKKEW